MYYVFIISLFYWWFDPTTPSLLLAIGRLSLVMGSNKNISFSLSLFLLFSSLANVSNNETSTTSSLSSSSTTILMTTQGEQSSQQRTMIMMTTIGLVCDYPLVAVFLESICNTWLWCSSIILHPLQYYDQD